MRPINEIIIHCAATEEGRNFTVEDIRRWHVQGNGWKDIGYHYVIYLDGSVHPGRPLDQAGAHTTGHNANSIGICYIGGLDLWGKPKNTMTPFQIDAMLKLVNFLQWMYPKAKVYGHNEFANKDCPCFDVHTFLGFC
jgi:N-acetylmuramoyl-L-alanine amidase